MSQPPTHEELRARILDLESTVRRMERERTEKQDEINWLRLLLKESRDGIVVLDQQAKVYDANPRFAAMLGYTLEEVRHLHVWDWEAVAGRDTILGMVGEVDAAGHHFETQHRRKDGALIHVELSNNGAVYQGQKLILCICREITARKRAEQERDELIAKLKESLAEIRTLRGILPVCCFCKKVRDDDGYWEQVDVYIKRHSEADISHSICPDCLKKNYPDYYEECMRREEEREDHEKS